MIPVPGSCRVFLSLDSKALRAAGIADGAVAPRGWGGCPVFLGT